MKSLLKSAGCPQETLDEIQAVCDTCRICRMWIRPGPKNAASVRLSTAFNQSILLDLLFFKDKVILHIVDDCIRWTVAVLLKYRSTEEVMKGFVCHLFQPFGPPEMVICDGEGALG